MSHLNTHCNVRQVEGSNETTQLEMIYGEIFLFLFWGYVKQ